MLEFLVKDVPKKMIKNFCGTTLTDIFLSKLAKLKKNIDVFFAGFEKVFKTKMKNMV